MVDFKYFLNTDYFKIGNFGDKRVRHINMALAAICGVFIISFLFYMIMYSSTNFNSLGDLEEYLEKYSETSTRFDNINIGLKIMPSSYSEDNVLYMERSNNYYKSKIPNSLSLMESYNMNNTFFFINNTKSVFPTLNFKKESVPIGDSMTMCVSASWTGAERGNKYKLMKQMEGFDLCEQTKDNRIVWNQDDTRYGVDIPVWTQTSYDVDCTDDADCDSYCQSYNAEYVNGLKGKKCYAYDILDYICLVIEWDDLMEDYKFVGGCLKDGAHYSMVPADRNTKYKFENIEIEIRNKKDPVIYAGEISDYTFSFGSAFSYVAKLLNILLFFSMIGLILIAFQIWHWRKRRNSSALIDDNNVKSEADVNNQQKSSEL